MRADLLARRVAERFPALRLEDGGGLLHPPTAVFSPCGTHRYLLTRTTGEEPPTVFVMLNPSTADAMADDPTITRVRRRAIRAAQRGLPVCGGLVVVNLFALRSTDPAALLTHPGPIGPYNDEIILMACQAGMVVVAAWGAGSATTTIRAAHVTAMLHTAGIPLWCLGTTKHGQPRHPLYIPAATELHPYRPHLATKDAR
jgi:hypothetical protein